METNLRKNIERNLDFSPKENKVIDALICLKMARTTSRISREAGLPRTTTIRILEKLGTRRIAIKIEKKIKKGTGKGVRYVWKLKRIPTLR